MEGDGDGGARVQVGEEVGLEGGGDGRLEFLDAFVGAGAAAAVGGGEGGDVDVGVN